MQGNIMEYKGMSVHIREYKGIKEYKGISGSYFFNTSEYEGIQKNIKVI